MKKEFGGVYTALVTPFKNEKIDFASLEKLINFQLNGHVDGFVVNGTTGESPNLNDEEVCAIFDFVKKKSPKNIKIILGVGSNSTSEVIKKSQSAERIGADALLSVVPYYNKPPQRGLLEHFIKSSRSVSIPTILYNVPGRTIAKLELETIYELSKEKNIIGIKEASGNIEFAEDIRNKCGKEFTVLSGDDGTYIDFLISGGDGVISVASHILPNQFHEWTLNYKSKTAEVLKDFSKYKKLIEVLFIEANPIPIKMALKKMSIIQEAELRLPLVELEKKYCQELELELRKVELI